MFDSMGSILEALSPEQQIACSTQNNILLTACPGSGKTRTLTHRLAYQVLRDPASKKIKIILASRPFGYPNGNLPAFAQSQRAVYLDSHTTKYLVRATLRP